MSKMLLLLLFMILLSSCAQETKLFQPSETVTLDNIQFNINSAEFASSFYNFVNQPSYPNATFLIVDISIKNMRTKAIPSYFKPVFTLFDNNGTEYKKSEQGTIMINMGQHGLSSLEDLNPNVTFREKIVFDVPKQKYKLQVLVPSMAQLSFGGYQNLTGRYFYFDLSEIDSQNRKYVDIQKILNSSDYGLKAKSILERDVKEKQTVIDKKGANIQDLIKASASYEVIQKEKKEYTQLVTESQDYVKNLELKLTDFIIQKIKSVSSEIANKNNYIVVYDSKDTLGDVSNIVMKELNNKSSDDVETYYNLIK